MKTDRKIIIVGIEDHELTGLNVVTAATLFDTQKGPVIGIFHEYTHLGKKGRSVHAVGRWNCSTARLMTDPKLLEVLRELKPLMDMGFYFALNLVWFTCTPSGLLLMMIFSNIPTSTMVLPLPLFRKFNKKLMIPCSKILC